MIGAGGRFNDSVVLWVPWVRVLCVWVLWVWVGRCGTVGRGWLQ